MQIPSSPCLPCFLPVSSLIFFFFFFIVVVTFPTSFCLLDEKELFRNCSAPFNCGQNFANISYPFWGGNRSSSCGLPGFHLTCRDDDYLTIDIADRTFRVVNFSRTSVAFPIARDDLWQDVCPENFQNFPTGSYPFYPGRGTIYLPLYYDCPNSGYNNSRKPFPCTNTSDNERVDLFADVSGCGLKNVIVLALEGGFEVFKNNTSMTLRDLLYQGYDMEFELDGAYCAACKVSGGVCWSGSNSTGNRCLCSDGYQDTICPTEHKTKLGLKLGIGFGAAGGSALIFGLIFFLYHRKQKKSKSGSTLLSREISSYPSSASDPEKGLTSSGVHIFDYGELEEATNFFDSEKEIGDGGFGTVYKGKLKDGRDVAVKRLYESNFKRVDHFRNEVVILTRLRHKNLVTLYGCTSRHSRELLLVYEYVPNGTVADHLHGVLARPGSLPWITRMKIAIETASALSYLHASDVIHRDVKTNNILLDNNFNVKVADFGLSRLFPINATHISTAPQGTPGYVDPEYHQCYHLTDKSDVYSFGVVLIELISSMPAVDISRHRHEINLSNMAINKIQSHSLHELVDPNLGFESDENVRLMITDVAELAFQSLQYGREMRPSMEEVLETLIHIQSKDPSAVTAIEKDIQADHGKLLNNRKIASSPDTVIEGWVSTKTTPSTSN